MRRPPALVILRFDPDARSATAIRRSDPDWAKRFADHTARDEVTFAAVQGGTSL
jgi:nicotinate-nucleotide adenylyltransferase